MEYGVSQPTDGGIAAPKRNGGTLLSEREQDGLPLVAEGLSNKQIAKELIIAESTVRYHLTSVFNKLGVGTRAQAVATAVRKRLLDGL